MGIRASSGQTTALVALIFFVIVTTASAADRNVPLWSSGGGGGSGTGTGYRTWQSYLKINGYVQRPPEEVVQQVSVKWDEHRLDQLGNILTIHGRLRTHADSEGKSEPVNWFQGLSIYLHRTPDTEVDWSQGINLEKTLDRRLIADPDGRFTFEFNLRGTKLNRGQSQSFQLGIALARHSGTYERQEVNWDTQVSALPSSIKMVTIPAAPKLSVEQEVLNRACNWYIWPQRHPNSIELIRAVNSLQRLGRDRAIEVLREFVQTMDVQTGYSHEEMLPICWIIRMLFEPTDADPTFPKQHWLESKYDTIRIVADIPFLVQMPFWTKGTPQHPKSHLQWALLHGRFRDHQLAPTRDPIQAMQSLLEQDELVRERDAAERKSDDMDPSETVLWMRRQALGMVMTALPDVADPCANLTDAVVWGGVVQLVTQRHLEWDSVQQEFVSKSP